MALNSLTIRRKQQRDRNDCKCFKPARARLRAIVLLFVPLFLLGLSGLVRADTVMGIDSGIDQGGFGYKFATTTVGVPAYGVSRQMHTKRVESQIESEGDAVVGLAVVQNSQSKVRSRSEVVREVKQRYNAEVLKIQLNQSRTAYRVRILMPNGRVREVTVSARP